MNILHDAIRRGLRARHIPAPAGLRFAPLTAERAGTGAGSMTISSVTSQRVVGTFSFELTPIPVAFGTTSSLRGQCDLTFHDRPLC